MISRASVSLQLRWFGSLLPAAWNAVPRSHCRGHLIASLFGSDILYTLYNVLLRLSIVRSGGESPPSEGCCGGPS